MHSCFISVKCDLLTLEQFSGQFGLLRRVSVGSSPNPTLGILLVQTRAQCFHKVKWSKQLSWGVRWTRVWLPGAVQFCGAEGQETRAAPSTASVQRSYKKHRPSLSMSAQSRPSPNTTSPPLRSQALDTFSSQRFLYALHMSCFFFFVQLVFAWHRACVFSDYWHCPLTIITFFFLQIISSFIYFILLSRCMWNCSPKYTGVFCSMLQFKAQFIVIKLICWIQNNFALVRSGWLIFGSSVLANA